MKTILFGLIGFTLASQAYAQVGIFGSVRFQTMTDLTSYQDVLNSQATIQGYANATLSQSRGLSSFGNAFPKTQAQLEAVLSGSGTDGLSSPTDMEFVSAILCPAYSSTGPNTLVQRDYTWMVREWVPVPNSNQLKKQDCLVMGYHKISYLPPSDGTDSRCFAQSARASACWIYD